MGFAIFMGLFIGGAWLTSFMMDRRRERHQRY